MKKRSFRLVLLLVIIGLGLGGCACLQPEMKAETLPPSSPPAVVETTAAASPAPVAVPERPLKKDRN